MDSQGNNMASQIQGLKKVAAANRNKTKSQMRESTNGGPNAASGAYGTRDSNQNYNSEAARQSAQTALGTHGMGALQGQPMNATTKIVGLRSQSKQDQMLNTRSSSVARLQHNNNTAGSQNVNIMASTQPRQVSNSNKRGLPYVASQNQGAPGGGVPQGNGATSKQRHMNQGQSTRKNNEHQMQQQQQHMNYMDGGIDVNDYNNAQSRKTPVNGQSRTNQLSQNTSNGSNLPPNGNRIVSKTSLEQNQYQFQQNHANTGERKTGKGNKMRHSQNLPVDTRQRQMYNQMGNNNLVQQNGYNVNASSDLINFKNGASPNTQMNFFKANNTQQIALNQKNANAPTSGNNRKSQSTGRQGFNNRQGGATNVNQQQKFQNLNNSNLRRNNPMAVSGMNTQGSQNNNDPAIRQARYASQNQMRQSAPNGVDGFVQQDVNGQLILSNQTNSAPGKKGQNNQSDIYKVYLNYMPNQGPGVGAVSQQQMPHQQMNTDGNMRITPQKRESRGGSGTKQQQNIVMKNRQNMLKQSNQIKSNQKISADTANKALNQQQLPLIQSSLNNQQISDIQTNFVNQGSSVVSSTGKSANGQNIANKQNTGSSVISQGSVNQMHVRRQGNNNTQMQNGSNPNHLSTQQYNSNNINTYISSVNGQPNVINGNQSVNTGPNGSGNSTAIYKTNTLDQYGGRNSALQNINAIVGSSVMNGTGGVGHHRNHASNQSANMIVRGMTGVNLMNYSILQSELEQETASLEDMHMFFVAFNHRQNKIIQSLEKSEMVAQANDRQNLLYTDDVMQINDGDDQKASNQTAGQKKSGRRSSKTGDKTNAETATQSESKQPMNVILLKNEVDLE